MKNTDKAAMPQPPMFNKYGTVLWGNQSGLTKREHYAGLAMQGLVSNPNFRGSFKEVSEDAVGMADALLAALEEQ